MQGPEARGEARAETEAEALRVGERKWREGAEGAELMEGSGAEGAGKV